MLFPIIKSNKKNTFKLFKKTDIFGPIFSLTSFNGYLNIIFCTGCGFNQFLLSTFLSQNHTLRPILLTQHPKALWLPNPALILLRANNNPALSATEIICCLFTVRSIGAKAELGQSLYRGWSRMVLRKVSIRWSELSKKLGISEYKCRRRKFQILFIIFEIFSKTGGKIDRIVF